jgi:hypothetical protein
VAGAGVPGTVGALCRPARHVGQRQRDLFRDRLRHLGGGLLPRHGWQLHVHPSQHVALGDQWQADVERPWERSANQSLRTSQALEQGMDALEQRNAEILALGEMSRVLQTEMTLAEALEITGLFCDRLLQGTSGTVFLFRNSADLLAA